MKKNQLQSEICQQLCTNIRLVERENGTLMISTPFSYPDGDNYSIYLKQIEAGKIRLSDEANTMMRLSYDTPDVNKYFKDSKGKLMENILRENRIQEQNGNFYVDVAVSDVSDGIFRLGQALNQIYDLSYLNQHRSISSFYKELEELLNNIVSEHPVKLAKEYVVPGLENAENYIIDYSLQRENDDLLFLFGIPTADKAHLVTITLQRLLLNNNKMPTLLIFENQADLPPKHLGRVMDANIGGSLVSSIESTVPIQQNIERHVLH